MAIIRYGSSDAERGERYLKALNAESEKNFKILLSLLSSYWQTKIDGPNYARELKAVAIELSKIRIALEDIKIDVDWKLTRTEFLYQLTTSFLFPDRFGAPNLRKTDVEFREFLTELVKIYFKGSIPDSIEKVMGLLVDGDVIVKENFLEARKSGSSYDISDQFGFSLDVIINNPGDLNSFLIDKNVRILLSIIRPAHTLYRLRFVMKDEWNGQDPDTLNPITDTLSKKIQDSKSETLSSYGYEDLRKFVDGVFGVDEIGAKKSISVENEDHSDDF